MRPALSLALVALGCTGIVPPPAANDPSGDSGRVASDLIQAQVDAYNAHDVAALMTFYADSAVIYRLPSTPLLVGHAAIRADFTDWFAKVPSVRVAIANRIAAGSYVVDHERLTGVPPDGPASAVVIYEVAAGKIQKVWLVEESTPQAETSVDSVAAAIIRLEQSWADAEARHDDVTVAQLLADDHLVTTPDGAVFDKQAVVAAIRGDTTTVLSAKIADAHVRVYGHAAVITGVTIQMVAGARPLPRQYRWTDTWIRGTDGQWRCVASQSMMLAARSEARSN